MIPSLKKTFHEIPVPHSALISPKNIKKPQTWCDCQWYGLFQFCLFVETYFVQKQTSESNVWLKPKMYLGILFYKNVESSFSTWLAHLTLRFFYILGYSGPRCAVPWCKQILMQLFKNTGPIVKKERGLANQNHLTGNLFLHSSNAANFIGCNGQFGFSPHII